MAVHAQVPTKISIEGVVTDFDTKEPLTGCVVTIQQFSLWAVTNDAGKFRFISVPTGILDIEVSYIGYEKLVYNLNVSQGITNLQLRVKPTSLALDQVVVTATQGGRLNTSTRIDRQAMEHIQATTVKGYLDLLPGAVMKTTYLKDPSIISLRDIIEGSTVGSGNSNNSNSVNAFGTNIIVDGASMNDKASISGNYVTRVQSGSSGFDTRQLSINDVESIEVITGVASAEYGDLNSGAVVIKTRAGRTPFEFSARTNPDSKMFSLSKGIQLGKKSGFLNIGTEYTKAFDNIRTDERAYDREGFNARYSNTFNNNRTPISFNFSVSGYMSQGSTNNDPDKVVADELYELKNQSMTFNANGTWQINKPWLTALRYNVNYRFNNALSRDYKSQSPSEYRRLSMVEGLNIAGRANGSYMTDVRNESKAAYTTMKLAADLSDRYGNIFNKLTAGVEWDNSGNRGRGEYFIGEQPQGDNLRNIDARDFIPFVNRYNAFAEDKITLPFNQDKSSISLSAGIRYAFIDTDILKENSVLDPRFNLKYTIIKNRRGQVKELSLRGGWGIQSAMPSLQFIYTLPTYFDREVLTMTSFPTREAARVFNTIIVNPEQKINSDLKIQRSHNFELGLEFDMFGVNGSVVYFNEQIDNGYTTEYLLYPESYKRYSMAGLTDDQVSLPQIVNGELHFNGQPMQYEVINQFRSVSIPINGQKVKKWGVEYSLNFGQIHAIRTSVALRGSYISRKTYWGLDEPIWNIYSSAMVSGKGYNPYVVAFNYSSNFYRGKEFQNLSSMLDLITHIPKLRMVTSLTIQGMLLRREQSIPNPDLYHMDTNGNRVYGDYTNGWTDSNIYRDPVLYKGLDGKVFPFNPALYDDPEYGAFFLQYRKSVSTRNYFVLDNFSPYFMTQIRLTKEIGNNAQVTFSVQNFTGSNPQRFVKSLDMYYLLNSEFTFGAEFKFKF
jgi:hypothetical protein